MKRVFFLFLLLATTGWCQTATHVSPDHASFQSTVASGSMNVYTVDVQSGQSLWVYLRPKNKNANFEIMDPDNNLVGSGRLDPYGFRKLLLEHCRSGMYTVVVAPDSETTTYDLTIQAQ